MRHEITGSVRAGRYAAHRIGRVKPYRFNRTTRDQLSRARRSSGVSSALWSRKASATVTGKAISASKRRLRLQKTSISSSTGVMPGSSTQPCSKMDSSWRSRAPASGIQASSTHSGSTRRAPSWCMYTPTFRSSAATAWSRATGCPSKDLLLEQTRYLHGVRVPTPEAELVLFALRIALKHTVRSKILMANRHYRRVSRELGWLREAANAERAEALCTAWFPTIDPPLFRQMLDAIEAERAVARRVVLGWRLAWRLRGLRRLSPMVGAVSRLWRVLCMLVKRFRRRRDLVLQTGGMIVALVGPKASGKSTIGHALATRLGSHLDVRPHSRRQATRDGAHPVTSPSCTGGAPPVLEGACRRVREA